MLTESTAFNWWIVVFFENAIWFSCNTTTLTGNWLKLMAANCVLKTRLRGMVYKLLWENMPTNSTYPHEVHEIHDSNPYAILFIFTSCTIGGKIQVIFIPNSRLYLMHMSSASPRGRTPGQPGEYVGEYKGWIRFSAPGLGEIREMFSNSKERGGGIWNFVKSRTVTTGISRGLPLKPNHWSKIMMTGQTRW